MLARSTYNTMPFYNISAQARQSQASPSVSLEKGAYRMRAPTKRSALSTATSSSIDSGSKTNGMTPRRRRGSHGLSRDGLPLIVKHERQMAMLVIGLVCAAVTSFAVAWYLVTTRCVRVMAQSIRTLLTSLSSA